MLTVNWSPQCGQVTRIAFDFTGIRIWVEQVGHIRMVFSPMAASAGGGG
jgi:hypothetical protein